MSWMRSERRFAEDGFGGIGGAHCSAHGGVGLADEFGGVRDAADKDQRSWTTPKHQSKSVQTSAKDRPRGASSQLTVRAMTAPEIFARGQRKEYDFAPEGFIAGFADARIHIHARTQNIKLSETLLQRVWRGVLRILRSRCVDGECGRKYEKYEA